MFSWLDWLVVGIFLAVSLGIGLWYAREGSIGTQNFFLGGRNLSWWVAGTSMVATTFAADTPLLITEIVATKGVSGNWLWWNGLIGGMISVFFFARLWRRANITTDVELIELRYSGQAAQWLRGFKAIYLGLFLNSIIIAWVNVALAAILQEFFGISPTLIFWCVAAAMLFTALYSGLSGLLGVALTDFVQFWFAMAGTVALAFFVVGSERVGGLSGLVSKLPPESLNFLPTLSLSGESVAAHSQVFVIGLGTFLAYVGFQWWASWYPGAEPGGGGYIAQRMMSTRSERDAIQATLFFQIAHYALRPLPWILVGLASIILYPELPEADKKLGYVRAMREFLPDGWRGLLIAAFLAAYMSTISTQLNWGVSYLINDFYGRFVRPNADNRQLVNASRWATFLLMLVALGATTQVKTMQGAFEFMISAGAGLGAVLMLRWYWWRINVWSEISATIAPFIGLGIAYGLGWGFPASFFLTVGITTVVWLSFTWLTPPTDLATLQAFYLQVQPQGAWRVIRDTLPNPPAIPTQASLGHLLGATFSAMCIVYGALFMCGELLFLHTQAALIYALLCLLGLLGLRYFGKKIFE